MRIKASLIAVALVLTLTLVVGQTAYAAHNDNNIKPGWGFGDKNHIHIGPPGHSIFPGDGDNDRDDGNNPLRNEIQAFVNQMVKFQLSLFADFFHHH